MKWVVIPDMQVPFHDRRATRNVTDFVRQYAPDGLLCVGDEIDSPETSHWNKGRAGEYAPTLQKSLNETHDVLGALRDALGYGKPFHLSRSNHSERTAKYVAQYAPALGCIDSLRIESLLRLDDIEVQYHHSMFEFAPGWVLAHGDEGSMSRIPGSTALNLGKKLGKSIVCGHTHRAGTVPDTVGFAGKLNTLWGFEVGHLMDIRKADYLRSGVANWQQAFGIIHADGRKVTPTLVPIHSDGTFTVEGRTYPG